MYVLLTDVERDDYDGVALLVREQNETKNEKKKIFYEYASERTVVNNGRQLCPTGVFRCSVIPNFEDASRIYVR